MWVGGSCLSVVVFLFCVCVCVCLCLSVCLCCVCLVCVRERYRDIDRETNSKYWFTTPFLQPLPKLITSQVFEDLANGQFFRWRSNGSKFVTDNSSYICFITAHVAYTSKDETKSFQSRRNSFLFLSGADAPHVNVRAWALFCFHSLIRA